MLEHAIARRASDVITQTNSVKQNGMVEDLTLFQARKQVFLKQFLKPKFVFIFLLFLSENASVFLVSVFLVSFF